MSVVTPTANLTALGVPLDTSPEKFGDLRDSSALDFDGAALRARMEEDGYLFLPGLLNRDEVLDARLKIAEHLRAEGHLMPGTPDLDCIAQSNSKITFLHEVGSWCPELMKVLYDGPMMAFYERFLDSPVRHFDNTWFRAIAPGLGTPPHTDAVYMNRGTHKLFTSWTPIGDVSLETGGLMVLENSHRHQKLRENYSTKDVDAFCENRVGAGYTGMGGGGNIREMGWLSNQPFKLREALGGRWLTAEFRAGDLLMFSIFTVHASLDNQSNCIRLSSDSRYQSAHDPIDERWIGPNPIAHGPAGKRAMIC